MLHRARSARRWRQQGIHLLGWDELTEAEREQADRYFRANVFPVLTPLAVDPGHPFPFISNLSHVARRDPAPPGPRGEPLRAGEGPGGAAAVGAPRRTGADPGPPAGSSACTT